MFVVRLVIVKRVKSGNQKLISTFSEQKVCKITDSLIKMNVKFIRRWWKAAKVYTLPYEVKPPYTHVVQIGDPVLRTVAKNIDANGFNSEPIRKLITLMKTIVVNDNLSGISAPQVGLPWRIIAVRFIENTGKELLTPEEFKEAKKIISPIEVWINPEMKIIDYSTNIRPEMCASVVSLKADVKRYNKISLTGLNESGETKSVELSGFQARIVQHEMDHLDGTIFTDKMNVKTLSNVLWKEINETNGFVELNYYPKADEV